MSKENIPIPSQIEEEPSHYHKGNDHSHMPSSLVSLGPQLLQGVDKSENAIKWMVKNISSVGVNHN